jgi:ABC-type Fe3+-hydroxamate transport system substrate-binding protein
VAIALILTACGGTAEPGKTTPSDDAAFPRTVEHAMGQTEIPQQPERVVVLDTGELDTALSLGVTPVGAVTTAVSDGFLSYLAEDAADVEVVGTIAEPNLEAIAALRPDLILSNRTRHEDLYDELSQIAPTSSPSASVRSGRRTSSWTPRRWGWRTTPRSCWRNTRPPPPRWAGPSATPLGRRSARCASSTARSASTRRSRSSAP